MSTRNCISLKLSLIGCFEPKESISLTNPGKMILSRTATVFSSDDLSGLSRLLKNGQIFPAVFVQHQHHGCKLRCAKQKFWRASDGYLTFYRELFDLQLVFDQIPCECQILLKFPTLAVLVKKGL